MSSARDWQRVCALEDLPEHSGVGAWLEGRQLALFRLDAAIHALGNYDPASGANVLSRGIVGDLHGEAVVASPMYKHHFSLTTGKCQEDAALAVPVYPVKVIDAAVWVRLQPAAASAPQRQLVVVGNGTAAMKVLEELQQLAPDAYQITVFGAESGGSYNRVLLSPLLAAELQPADIVTHPPSWFEERGIVLHALDPVTRIDRVRRVVHSHRGLTVPYDRLLIATGSQPVVLRIPGNGLAGVTSFRELGDVEAMCALATAGQPAVVIGGGLLGLEAASGLKSKGMDVTVVHVAAELMNRQLDAHAARMLRTELETRGLRFVMPARTAAIVGEQRVTAVRLDDGRELPAELVVMAVGVQPQIELAASAGIRCERGILVDDTLQTYDPAIYAVGECVQHRKQTYGLVAPLWEQARVCGAHLAGAGMSRYAGSRVATQLKVSGVEVFSAGDFQGGPYSESLVLRDERRGIYKRLIVENDRVRGAVLYGDTRDGRWYFELIQQQRNVAAFRDRLLFGEAECQAPA